MQEGSLWLNQYEVKENYGHGTLDFKNISFECNTPYTAEVSAWIWLPIFLKLVCSVGIYTTEALVCRNKQEAHPDGCMLGSLFVTGVLLLKALSFWAPLVLRKSKYQKVESL